MIEGAIIAAAIMAIGRFMSPGAKALVQIAFFLLFLLPLCIILWKVGAFQMVWDMIVMILRAFVEVFIVLISGAWAILF